MNQTPNIQALDDHIAEIRKIIEYCDDLETTSYEFRRYLGGLIKARELVTGEKLEDKSDMWPEKKS